MSNEDRKAKLMQLFVEMDKKWESLLNTEQRRKWHEMQRHRPLSGVDSVKVTPAK